MNKTRILIIGGVAGGATAAARARRMDEEAEIIVFERGEYISYANCGLPYYIGGVISRRERLLVTTKEAFAERYRLDVRVLHEVTAIDPKAKRLRVLDKAAGEHYEERYDKLVIATGASPFIPEIPGREADNVFSLWTIPDTDRIQRFIAERRPRRAVVVGGGFIGVEMAENLVERGLEVSLVEKLPQIMAVYDPEMARLLENELSDKGVRLHLGKGVARIEEGGSAVVLDSGERLPCDMVLLSIGTRPNSALAREAGLETNARGGIVVDANLRSSDPDIFAVGDVAEVGDFNSGGKTMLPLAGPANRQARLVADNLFAADGRARSYDGAQGSSVIKVFDLTAAVTGLTEQALGRMGKEYRRDYLVAVAHPVSHASYYPGAAPLSLKLIFDLQGRVLGAQAVGYEGVEKRIDVIAAAIRFKGSVYDLQDLELCYAPPYSSAKDPVNVLGYIAANQLEGLSDSCLVRELESLPEETLILDLREEAEQQAGMIPRARSFPLSTLRARLHELPKDRPLVVYCATGLRSYLGERILKQNGFSVRNLGGAYRSYVEAQARECCSPPAAESAAAEDDGSHIGGAEARATEPTLVDACGLSCPGPIMAVAKAVDAAAQGERLRVLATDPGFARDIASWCVNTGNRLIEQGREGERYSALIERGQLSCAAEAPRDSLCVKEKTMIVFSGDLDKAIAAFIIANGAAAMGNKVNLFFTFWGLNILRKAKKQALRKDLLSRMFGALMPRGSRRLGLSRMNFCGAGAKLIRGVMKKHNIASLEELIGEARENGVRMTACQMSMDVMGIRQEELLDGVEIGGVAAMLNDNDHSNMNLFI